MKGSVISPFAVVAVALLTLATVENSQAAASQPATEAPVEFIYGGITPDKAISYKIKVNTNKPILEVHMKLKEMDASGKVLFDGDLVWQNIVHSTEQPIEQGKTYDATMMLPVGAVKVECSFKEVIFKDYTRWSATASAQATPTPAPPATKPPQTSEPPRVTESPAPKAPDRLAAIQAEVESFIKSVYRDMEQNDPGKVLASFAETVDYYSYGPKDKAFIAEQLRQYFAAFPTRSFSVGEVTLQAPPSTSRKVSATFDVRYSLKDASKGTTSTGRSHVEWDLVKPDKVIKIVRFTGTSNPDAP
jgi:hypothetical protein